MKIPLFDLTRQYIKIRQEILTEIDKVISSGRVILGENVSLFEEEIANFVGVKHAIGVANGSDALFIALKALGIGEGDYVITTPYTFFATVSCITRNRAIPIFVDIDPVTYNIDLDKVEEVLTSHPNRDRIKAFIPVHLFGQTVNLERLEYIKQKYGIKILEDCAQSIGSTWTYSDGTVKRSGSIGDAAVFSFFPTKNLGAYGDGGMIVANDDEIAEFCRSFRVHGSKTKYVHDVVGINSRLDEIQAAVLRVKFRYLQEYTNKRREIAKEYQKLFEDTKSVKEMIVWPNVPDDNSHVFHQYVIRVKNGQRDVLREFLKEKGIGTSIYYPMGLHQQKCFAYLNIPKGSLPETERASKESLALPIFPELKIKEVEYIVLKILEYRGG
ncbi:DegT/DnrJ/EryC1/StrS family aminotransferase [Kosmotoga pacifica]|uniref:Pleiotropic regulatory protein n=1 Tax=Kosmotoga pacifica TaxID=1330330 RepID=A0A0G2Z8X3_9BACT|nr:DegT/DnrJ/EryC1/StrS family aminotransferase [Kosmotoga pacifica]AKI96521.1 Pleiotropic regulatory protein [Kosmotoga pacifica]